MSRRSRDRRAASKPIPGWITIGAVAIAWWTIAWLERRSPSRARRENELGRTGRNVAMASLSTGAVWIMQNVVLDSVWKRASESRTGILPTLRLPRALEVASGVLLLDYTLWWWHWMNHKWPLLWRFHLVHHVDRDLDASTGIRFHFGEMSMSVLFRILQMRLIGPDRFATSLWQTLLLISIHFHHSAIRFSEVTDDRIALWIVSPRMHEIHHSDYRDETDSNWSSLLSVWDRLHRTFRLDVPREAVRIGVPAYQDPGLVELPQLVVMPFLEQREDWRGPSGELRLERRSEARNEE
ncbi:MAG: sterol desaturase family protein [Thermoanaerobaculia bacterium]|nr:sterol desaturase family protein [Thermoanaerobaculia bacterium]